MKRWIISILAALLIGGLGCSKTPEPSDVPVSPTEDEAYYKPEKEGNYDGMLPPKSVHLIDTYIDPQEAVCKDFVDYEQLGINPAHYLSYNTVKWMFCSSPASDRDHLIAEYSDPVRFDSLVRAHQDTDWGISGNFPGPSMFRVTTGLHVVCNRDYDAAHPAGTLLDKVLNVSYYTADRVLVDGVYIWKELTDKQDRDYYRPKQNAVLSEFNQMRHKLIAMRFEFTLKKAPAETGTYVFTCTYTNEDGKELTASTDPIRIQGK